jgi:hypothetical protein
MMHRRGILGTIAGVGLFGPKAAQAIVHQHLDVPAVPPSTPPRSGSAGSTEAQQPVTPAMWKQALRNRAFRAEIESLYFENSKGFGAVNISPELQIKRSFSPMAKLTFARQDAVAARLKQLADPIDLDNMSADYIAHRMLRRAWALLGL